MPQRKPSPQKREHQEAAEAGEFFIPLRLSNSLHLKKQFWIGTHVFLKHCSALVCSTPFRGMWLRWCSCNETILGKDQRMHQYAVLWKTKLSLWHRNIPATADLTPEPCKDEPASPSTEEVHRAFQSLHFTSTLKEHSKLFFNSTNTTRSRGQRCFGHTTQR